MSKFELAIPLILKHEGSLTNDPGDAGGITNNGISLRYLNELANQVPEIIPPLDVNHNQRIDAPDIKALTLEEATEIYKKYWWERYKFGNIIHQPIANKIFDLAVNIGPKTAIKLLQEAYCKLQPSITLTIDGILGSDTFEKINSVHNNQIPLLLDQYHKLAENHYRNLVAQHPRLKKFLKGWIHRVYDQG